MEDIMGAGRKFCIIGTPVDHSKSPGPYRKIFDEHGYPDHTYVINEIKTREEFDSFISDMRNGMWDGCNVTMPWKTAAAQAMDVLLDNAFLTDSVNTVVNRGGVLYGDSTDGGGMCDAIISDTGMVLEGKKAVMLGCGGAARSIIAELALRHAGQITILGRPGNNMDLTRRVIDKIHEKSSRQSAQSGQSHKETVIEFCVDTDGYFPAEKITEADILINCTPLGMAPDTGKLPIPEDIRLSETLIVADAVYNPDETLLIRKAKACGCRTVKGIRMLELQAERASELYLDQ